MVRSPHGLYLPLKFDGSMTRKLRILTEKTHFKIKLKHSEKFEYTHLANWYIKSTIYKRFLY